MKSVDDVLKKHFGKSLASEGVHILDPFTGTGTFIVRTLTYLKEQMDNSEITLADITRKFTQELHANEIILLSYYIAAINIESTFDEINGDEQGYVPFEGIVLTDTFESTESENTLDDTYFGTNDERLKRQQEVPITAIIGNPPYSVGANDENDSEKNMEYLNLDNRIAQTYAKNSSSKSIRGLYDSYIKAIRWSSDRLVEKGVIGFVSNGSYIDSQSADGLRKSLFEEFNHLYIFNLRGDQRTQGETSRKEGGKIFGSGSRTPISISILVKDGSNEHNIYYCDIGDYLSRDDKLNILTDSKSINGIKWTLINPDENNDWINQRDQNYREYPSMLGDIFIGKQDGVQSNRDAWVWGFSEKKVKNKGEGFINNYNLEIKRLMNVQKSNLSIGFNNDSKFISWSRSLKNKATKLIFIGKKDEQVYEGMYYPFVKKYLYYDSDILEYPRKFKESLSINNNRYISVSGAGTKKNFSVLMNQGVPNYNLLDKARHFELYSYEQSNLLFEEGTNFNIIESEYLKSEEYFYYIYGVLNSVEYQSKYQNDLRKNLPHIPNLANKEKYIEMGKLLAELHLDYENQPNWNGVEVVISNPNPNYRVTKMKHPKKGVLDTIIYNEHITITNIPEKAYEYIVNGRPAIEWIIDQYRIKTDKKSGITDDPNEFSDDPKYILNLLLSIITVSMATLELIEELPEFKVIN